MDSATLATFAAEHWGDLASVVGVGVSVWTLVVARRAREAAIEARTEARRSSLAEELRDAHRKAEQVGIFVIQRKWDIVFLRAQEITGVTGLVLSRWGADLGEDSRSRMLECGVLASSIAKAASGIAGTEASRYAAQRVAATQQKMLELLGTVLGECIKIVEKE